MPILDTVSSRFSETFGGDPDAVAYAPGRVEVIGNHTDYNLGPVIGAAIDKGVAVAARRIDAPVFRLFSASNGLAVVREPSQRQSGAKGWTNYILGVYGALKKRGLRSTGGFEVLVESDLPTGAGLSSSAALEAAAALALCRLCDFELSKSELVQVAREAENEFVGVPCGILDQGVSVFGEANRLVHIDCRSSEFSTLPFPKDICIWIFNTHAKHSLVDSLYAKRHEECYSAVEALNAIGVEGDCLADVSAQVFERHRAGIDRTLAKRAEHVIREIDRVGRCKALLESGDIAGLGELLFSSHESSRSLFENSVPELDYLVELLRSMPSVYGARLTGGGFGGAAMALTANGFSRDYADSVASAYRGRFGIDPLVVRCEVGIGATLVR